MWVYKSYTRKQIRCLCKHMVCWLFLDNLIWEWFICKKLFQPKRHFTRPAQQRTLNVSKICTFIPVQITVSPNRSLHKDNCFLQILVNLLTKLGTLGHMISCDLDLLPLVSTYRARLAKTSRYSRSDSSTAHIASTGACMRKLSVWSSLFTRARGKETRTMLCW